MRYGWVSMHRCTDVLVVPSPSLNWELVSAYLTSLENRYSRGNLPVALVSTKTYHLLNHFYSEDHHV